LLITGHAATSGQKLLWNQMPKALISELFPYNVVTAATKLQLMQETKEKGNVGEQYVL